MNQLLFPFLVEKASVNSGVKPKEDILVRNLNPQVFPADLSSIWKTLACGFFPDRPDLHKYSVVWSKRRHKRSLATCNLKYHRVIVARELSLAEHAHVLEPLLYHEMCHAVLGYSTKKQGQRISWHGREFKALESRHPGIEHLNGWIRAGGWRRAIRQDRARNRKTKTIRTKKSGLRKLIINFANSFITEFKRRNPGC